MEHEKSKGIILDPKSGKYIVTVRESTKVYMLGRFETAPEGRVAIERHYEGRK